MIRHSRYPLVSTLVLLIAGLATASRVYTTVSSDTLTLGDRIALQVGLVVPKGATVVPPETDPGFGNFVVKEWMASKSEQPGTDSLTFSYVVTTYTMEACSIPALRFLQLVDSSADTLLSRTIPMRVISVINVDTADIKSLKPQQKAGKPSLLWLWLLLAGIVGVAAFLGGRFLVRKFRKGPPPPPPVPPYDEATDALNRLEAAGLIRLGQIREYVFRLSEILKRYIERRFEVNAQEFTTEEIVDWIAASPAIETSDKRKAEWFFRTTDPVKFAKFIPDDATLARMLDEVRSVVENTRPQPEPTSVAGTGPDAQTGVSTTSASSARP